MGVASWVLCVRYAMAQVYPGLVESRTRKRTNINLDRELVEEAAELLGTVRTTDTVHAALRDVVARGARERLAERDFEDLTPAGLARMRHPREHP
jgi:Arc/MetJ family transcription regulator